MLQYVVCYIVLQFKRLAVIRRLVCYSVLQCVVVSSVAVCMWWLRSVGSIKLQVSFAEYCLFYRALLHNRFH